MLLNIMAQRTLTQTELLDMSELALHEATKQRVCPHLDLYPQTLKQLAGFS